jgi:hypothetical protein
MEALKRQPQILLKLSVQMHPLLTIGHPPLEIAGDTLQKARRKNGVIGNPFF